MLLSTHSEEDGNIFSTTLQCLLDLDLMLLSKFRRLLLLMHVVWVTGAIVVHLVTVVLDFAQCS